MEKQDIRIRVDDLTELRLRTEADVEEYFSVIDRNRTHLRQWLPWLDAATTSDNTRAHIQKNLEKLSRGEFPDLGIWHQNQWVGSIGFHEIDHTHHRTTLGYWLGKEFEGKGLMTASVKTLVDYGFKELDLNRIEIHCAVENKKSCAIPERLGFTQEGIMRQYEWLYDHYVDSALYSMLKQDWQKTALNTVF